MLEFGHRDGSRPKCYFTHSVLPAFVDHEQPSQKKKPFSTIQEYPHTHTLDLVLPRDAHDAFLDKLSGKDRLQYAKVYMKLSDLVEGDFFNEYIKTGDILMLSEGRAGIDNISSLRDGILRLEIDKASYERTGLSGTPIPSEGRKHVKARYTIEINLRLPSMVRGKQGLERIIWAFKNVLNERKTWLFYDLRGANDGTGPIAIHQPIINTSEPKLKALGNVVVPPLPEVVESSDQQTPFELLEWLSMTTSQSPRVLKGDGIDTYLSRYRLPGTHNDAEPNAQELMRIRWHGFMPANFVQTVVVAALQATGKDWFALSSRSFGGETHAFLQHEQHTLTWEFRS